MYSPRKHHQARFVPNILGRGRQSVPPQPSPDAPSRSSVRSFFGGRTIHEELSFCEDDLLDLDLEDISEALAFQPYPQLVSQGLTPPSTCSTCSTWIATDDSDAQTAQLRSLLVQGPHLLDSRISPSQSSLGRVEETHKSTTFTHKRRRPQKTPRHPVPLKKPLHSSSPFLAHQTPPISP